MKTFTIENESNNITVHSSAKEAELVTNSERFGNEAALLKLAANWPAARLTEIWNSLPGATPIKKFTDRATAVNRIWKALQTLGQTESTPAVEGPGTAPIIEQSQETSETEPEAPAVPGPAASIDVAPQTPDVAPEAAAANVNATDAKNTPKAAKDATVPREGSKTSQVIAMLKREGGATLEEIMTAMKWQKHTTRAMLSAGGSIKKNHGLTVVSEMIGEKRTYSIKS